MNRSFGTEILRIQAPNEVSLLDEWIHDAYVEDAIEFSPEERRAVIPFAQESGWGDRHPSMADPELVKTTPLARHYEVPLTRCYIVIEHVHSLDPVIDWGCPTLVGADYVDREIRLSGIAKISVRVSDLDIRVFVSAQEAGRLLRKVLRGWPAESDRWLNPPD